MSKQMEGLLLEDRWAPVTSEMGFLEFDAERAARAHAAWHQGLWAADGVTVDVRPVSGSLEQVLSALLPLTDSERQRYLFIPTRSTWTAYLDNALRGTDAASAMGHMARRVGCRAMRVDATPHTLRGDRGRYGGLSLALYGPHLNQWHNNTLRSVYVVNDGGRWVFGQSGEPFPFEQVERYQARKVRERFTFDMLKEYLGHLGLSPFDESFYQPPGAPAWLVEKRGGFVEEGRRYTLAEARADF